MGRLNGRVAWITGAASGIGLACARRFAAEGATVVGFDLAACPDADWKPVTEAAPASGFATGDVRDEDAQRTALQAVVAQHGRVDVVVTAAGVAGGGPVHLVGGEDWDRVVDINLKGTFLSCKVALPTMVEQRSGSLITVASVEGLEAAEGGSAYNASKGGVVLLTRNLAMDYGRIGIRANCICPGFIDTPLFRSVMMNPGMEEVAERTRLQHKLGRFGRPDEIAGAALFFASDDASFVTGQALAVDGGYTAGKSVGITEMMGLA
jgi:NAD(P)-dependent dehydrogenase (short-subunit alcohol dehydrogenase family)